jgi:hypothetical protein
VPSPAGGWGNTMNKLNIKFRRIPLKMEGREVELVMVNRELL